MMRKFYVDDSAKGGYDRILRRDLLIELLFILKTSDIVSEVDDGPFKRYTTPMVDLGTYEFKN